MRLDTKTIAELRDTLLRRGRRPTQVMSVAYETLARAGMLEPEESAALQWVDPIGEAVFLAITADGMISDEERDAMRGAVRTLSENVIRSGTFNVMLESYAKRVADEGREARLAAVADAIAEEANEAEGAFALAAAVALADEVIADEEHALIDQLAEALSIGKDRRREILKDLEARRSQWT